MWWALQCSVSLSDAPNQQADALARRLEREAGPDLRKQIDMGYRLVAGWIPSTPRLLNKLNGEKRSASFGEVKYKFVNNESRLLGTKRTFKRYGKSGIEVSDLFPNLAQCIDDIAVIRSCHGDMVVYSAAQTSCSPEGSFQVFRAWVRG
jgi:hypothetical protein